MTSLKKFNIFFVLSFFLYSCTKTKSDYIQDLDGKLYMNDVVARIKKLERVWCVWWRI